LFSDQVLRGVEFEMGTNRLYVNSMTSSAIFIYNVQTETEFTLINTISTPPLPQSIKININKIYVGDRNGHFHIYDQTNNTLISTTNNICGVSTIIDSINFDPCHGALVRTCRTQRFQYIYRDGTSRIVTTNGSPRALFFDYRKRLWINEGNSIRIYD
jgi:hypothetical protein